MTDLDDTVTAPRRPLTVPVWDAPADLADTVIVPRSVASASQPGEGRARTGPDRSRADEQHRAGEDEPPSGADTAPIARYYGLRLGGSLETILLDVPCYVGRRPSPPRIRPGEVPRLLRVPSPLKEVSASHLEVRQRGSSVIITDLRSTNGSVIMVPGSVPRKLRQGESVVVSPGTLVDIGDDNILQILPAKGLV